MAKSPLLLYNMYETTNDGKSSMMADAKHMLNTLTANVHFCLLCVHLPCAIGTETVSFLNNCRVVTARVIMT